MKTSIYQELNKALKQELERYKLLHRCDMAKAVILENAASYYKDRALKAETELVDLKIQNWPSLVVLRLPNGDYKSYEIKRKE